MIRSDLISGFVRVCCLFFSLFACIFVVCLHFGQRGAKNDCVRLDFPGSCWLLMMMLVFGWKSFSILKRSFKIYHIVESDAQFRFWIFALENRSCNNNNSSNNNNFGQAFKSAKSSSFLVVFVVAMARFGCYDVELLLTGWHANAVWIIKYQLSRSSFPKNGSFFPEARTRFAVQCLVDMAVEKCEMKIQFTATKNAKTADTEWNGNQVYSSTLSLSL